MHSVVLPLEIVGTWFRGCGRDWEEEDRRGAWCGLASAHNLPGAVVWIAGTSGVRELSRVMTPRRNSCVNSNLSSTGRQLAISAG